MGKSDASNKSDDEAKEKMLNKLSNEPVKNNSEVVFMSENGKAKINDGNMTDVLSGMSKDELILYANDPFWVKLRWLLFVGFWALWFSMLTGAALIIIGAPKCSSTLSLKWWAKSPIVRLEPSHIIGKNAIFIENLLDTLKQQSIHSIVLTSILSEKSENHVVDFNSINPQITVKELANFIDAAKNRSQKVILEFDVNYSGFNHKWFNDSVNRIEPYTSYYVWADGKNATGPPNNWLSVKGGSAWEWNNERKQYYLHQFEKTQPDLNFNNVAVIDEFTKTFVNWIKFGFHGFRLGGTQYLTEDTFFSDDLPIQGPAGPLIYKSFNHVNTKNRHADNIKILAQWRDAVANITDNEGLFTLKDDTGDDALAIFEDSKVTIDLPQRSNFIGSDTGISAESLQKRIVRSINGAWPGWDFSGNRPSKHLSEDSNTDSLILMSLLLPGTPILKLDDCLNNSSAFSKVAAKRNEETFLYGDFQSDIINQTIFTYIRMKSSHPGYLIAYQSAAHQLDIDFSSIPFISSELTLVAHSQNYNRNATSFAEKMSSKKIPMSPKSTLVLTFITKK